MIFLNDIRFSKKNNENIASQLTFVYHSSGG
jgi:hypothetical protein